MDFREYTSLDQFDQKKIIRLARLDSLPGFSLLPREYEYLNLYRKLLVEGIEAEKDASASETGFAGKETEEKKAEEPAKEVPKTKKKAKKTEE